MLVAFDDPTATANTTYTANSLAANGTQSADVTATVLHTSEVLQMKVHTVNADGSIGTAGEMDFLLLDDYAPINIAHITALVNSGFYNTTATKTMTFHRVIQDFMIQGGDPTGTGSGGSGTGVKDDEFNTDVQFTSSGLLALANGGSNQLTTNNDTNDCQFFITSNTFADGDFQYTILGKLVAGDNIRQAIADVPVGPAANGELSKPLNPPIIDSVSIVPNIEYGLVMLKAGATATAGETASVTVTASDNSTVSLTGSDGTTELTLAVALPSGSPNNTPSINDRPAFINQNMPDVYTDVNTPVTVPIPAREGDAGVPLAYGASVTNYTGPDLQFTTSGSGPTDGSLTVTPSGDITGVYSVVVGVWRNDPNNPSGNSTPNTQAVALYVRPTAPASLSLAPMAGNNPIYDTNHPTFEVTGVTAGMTVAVFADGNSTPIGTAVASGDSVLVPTTTALAEGLHTFTVEQSVHYNSVTAGNRVIPAGDLFSTASASTLTFTVDTIPPTLTIDQAAGQADPTNSSTINFTAVFDEAVADFVAGDVAIGGTAGATTATVIPIGSDGKTYTVAVTGMTNDGTVTVSVPAGLVHDLAGNANVASTSTDNSVTYDITPPTVTINQAAGQVDPTHASTVNFTAVFSEPVIGFTAAGVTITGTAGATTATVTPVGSDGTTYTVTVSGITADGTVIVSLGPGVAHDLAGNLSVASTSTDNSVTVNVPPTATLGSVTVTASSIEFQVTYSNPGDVVALATIATGNVRITGPNGFDHLAALVERHAKPGRIGGHGDLQLSDRYVEGHVGYDQERQLHDRHAGPASQRFPRQLCGRGHIGLLQQRHYLADGDDQPGGRSSRSDQRRHREFHRRL